MDAQARPLSTEVTSKLLDRLDSEGSFRSEEDQITNRAFLLWINSQVYKQNRMSRIGLFERLYNNELPKKERQLFNVCLPIFAGFEDAIQANLTDPIQLQFESPNPADYTVMPKIQSQWESERDGMEPHQMWNQKARTSMHDALLSGRSIVKIFGENAPGYRNILETVNYSDFHCQPLGGVNLENHLFAGEEGIYMTVEDIISNDAFPKEQRDKIANFSYTDEWWQHIEESYGTYFSRFKSLGLNVNSNTFSGAKTLYLNQFIVTHKGVRWYVLFDPISQIWLRCEKWSDINGSDKYPWKTAATHEDSKNFWSKGFSDDIFQIALTISTLLNQELTNREKQNFNARAYDPLMFEDVAALDAAQYMPDRLVRADTQGGTKKISDGIYKFEYGQLQGTVNLIQWLESDLGKNVGISDLTFGQQKGGQQKAQVVLQQQQQVAKRIGFRAEPFKEMWSQVGESYVENLKEYMPAKLPIKIIGQDGFAEESELKRIEIKRTGNIGIKVVSTSAEQNENQAKKASRTQALGMVAQSPNINSQWRDEQIMRAVGEFSDDEIKQAMDTQSYGSRKMIAQASKAIQELLKGKKPDIYFPADIVFLQYLQDFMSENRPKLEKETENGVPLFLLFGQYTNEMAPYVQDNMQRKAKAMNAGRMPQNQQQGQDQGSTQPGKGPAAVSPTPQVV